MGTKHAWPLFCETLSFMMLQSKHVCPFLQRKTLSLPSKAVNYINIVENVVWNREQGMPHLQDVQRQGKPVENSFPTVQSRGMICQIRDSSTYGGEKQVFQMLPPGAYGGDRSTTWACIWVGQRRNRAEPRIFLMCQFSWQLPGNSQP